MCCGHLLCGDASGSSLAAKGLGTPLPQHCHPQGQRTSWILPHLLWPRVPFSGSSYLALNKCGVNGYFPFWFPKDGRFQAGSHLSMTLPHVPLSPLSSMQVGTGWILTLGPGFSFCLSHYAVLGVGASLSYTGMSQGGIDILAE